MARTINVDRRELMKFKDKFQKLVDNDAEIKNAIAAIGEQILRELIHETPVDTGRLKAQWRKDNSNIALQVHDTGYGWELTLVNTTEYASWVEKGHYAYNQYGGPWPVKNAKVPDSSGWVYGRFFVRKTENVWNNGKLDRSLTIRINNWIKNTLE